MSLSKSKFNRVYTRLLTLGFKEEARESSFQALFTGEEICQNGTTVSVSGGRWWSLSPSNARTDEVSAWIHKQITCRYATWKQVEGVVRAEWEDLQKGGITVSFPKWTETLLTGAMFTVPSSLKVSKKMLRRAVELAERMSAGR